MPLHVTRDYTGIALKPQDVEIEPFSDDPNLPSDAPYLAESFGDCLSPVLRPGVAWLVVDPRRLMRPGDLVAFAYRATDSGMNGLARDEALRQIEETGEMNALKFLCGYDAGNIIVLTLNPLERFYVPFKTISRLHRVSYISRFQKLAALACRGIHVRSHRGDFAMKMRKMRAQAYTARTIKRAVKKAA